MNFLSCLPLLITGLCLPLGALAGGGSPQRGPHPDEVREAVAVHRAARREEVRREEAWAGRRLTPSELAELREQVRQQWARRAGQPLSAESQPAERAVPALVVGEPLPPGRGWPARTARP